MNCHTSYFHCEVDEEKEIVNKYPSIKKYDRSSNKMNEMKKKPVDNSSIAQFFPENQF